MQETCANIVYLEASSCERYAPEINTITVEAIGTVVCDGCGPEVFGNIKRMAFSDELTGLGNRFTLAKSFREAVEEGEEFGIVHFDLENFKYINDTYGQEKGDQILKVFAEILKSARGEDRTAYLGIEDKLDEKIRTGGDEFAAIVKIKRDPGEYSEENKRELLSPEMQTIGFAERVRAEFAAHADVIAINVKAPINKQVGARYGSTVCDPQAEPDMSVAQKMDEANPKDTNKPKPPISVRFITAYQALRGK